MRYVFEDFELDTQRYELRQAGVLLPLAPQGFNVLAYLVEHRERVVSKQELLDQLWSGQHVTEATLVQRIVAARRALGDSGRTQRYIQTMHGRGYRFIAAVDTVVERTERATGPPALTPHPLSTGAPPAQMVGRETEMERLRQCFSKACAGARQVILITGEAGIGKTTLVDAFLAQIASTETVWVGRGQCIDHYGMGEGYLPLLEALGRLGREPDGPRLAAVLRQQAPSWLAQMPALASGLEAEELERRNRGATQARMLRELSGAMEALTLERPLVLVLEDLHWSDYATLDWLSFEARSRTSARLLVLGTYRPADAMVKGHPVNAMTHELERQGLGLELSLNYLPETAIRMYLDRRFGQSVLPDDWVTLLHQRTQGNPFFLVSMVNAWVQHGRLRESPAGWELQGMLEAIALEAPVSVRRLIEQQFEQLTVDEQTLLEVASVAGVEFSAATIAIQGNDALENVEAQCAALARRGQFIQPSGTSSWPDGTVASRYQFIHALYRDTLYERVAASRRQRLHLQLGLRLESAHADEASEIATELAEHFARGGNIWRAARYLQQAGQHAVQRSAYQEAILHFTRGLERLRTLSASDARDRQELTLQIALGASFTVTNGYGAPEAVQAYTRAKDLCQQIGDAPQLLWVMRGLLRNHLLGANLDTALSLAEELLHLAPATQDPAWLGESHLSLGLCLYPLGKLSQSLKHLERAIELFDPQSPRQRQPQREGSLYAGTNLGSTGWAHASRVLWTLGFPDQALKRSYEAIARSQDEHHPLGQALALIFAAELHQRFRKTHHVRARAEDCIALATTYGFPTFAARGEVLRGWALAAQGREQEGLAQLRHGVDMWLDSGARFDLPWYLILFTDTYKTLGRPEAGLSTLGKALSAAHDTGQEEYNAEIYGLRGALLLESQQVTEAESCFYQALDIARRQEAKSFELRAAISLAHLWQSQGKDQEVYDLLCPVYNWFTEGFDTEDLQTAKALLQQP